MEEITKAMMMKITKNSMKIIRPRMKSVIFLITMKLHNPWNTKT